ncbi:MAG: hypothetical protein HY426_04865 [Candidatus Levybacteria bacterium]|nr:hypothetical protein [Candidatus Levybacteria bacterium]
MSSKLIIALVIIALVGGGYLLLKSNEAVPYSTQISPSPQISKEKPNEISPMGVSIVINEQNSSNESGIATVNEVNGKVTVNLKLTGATSSIPQPAHLHKGICDNPGNVVFPLTSVVNGESMTVLEVDMAEFNDKLPLILNVHRSEQESDVYTACGPVSSN